MLVKAPPIGRLGIALTCQKVTTMTFPAADVATARCRGKFFPPAPTCTDKILVMANINCLFVF